jgi:transcription elongation GreA/GreB family factor
VGCEVTTIEQVLQLARAYVDALDAKKYSHAQRALTLLADATRQLPSWLEAAPIEPAAEVARVLRCESTLTLRNEDGAVVMVLRDEETCLAVALTSEEAKQLRGDVQRVMACSTKEAA